MPIQSRQCIHMRYNTQPFLLVKPVRYHSDVHVDAPSPLASWLGRYVTQRSAGAQWRCWAMSVRHAQLLSGAKSSPAWSAHPSPSVGCRKTVIGNCLGWLSLSVGLLGSELNWHLIFTSFYCKNTNDVSARETKESILVHKIYIIIILNTNHHIRHLLVLYLKTHIPQTKYNSYS